ncbi:MAG TPA: hypothetical protein VFN14_03995 [Candidatus Limnocylindria bacterium]|nr:hypothetical protein [Candidatus Limnocylindria bacterium]
MAILAPLFAFVGRFVGKVVQTIFGWATILLFGRVPESKQLLLSGVALGAIVWVATLLGVIFPNVGAFLVALVPAPRFVSETWIRIAMLIAALVLPILIGIAGLFLLDKADRPHGMARVVQVLRGYPYAAVLAFVLLFLAIIAPIRKLRSIIKRWDDAHIPVVVKPGGYETVGNDLEAALDGAGLPIERAKAPAILETPSKLLAAVGGDSVKHLVPDRLLVLKNRDLEVTIYPSDIHMTGTKQLVARSRAAIATTVTFTDAYQTTSKEAQQLEDTLQRIAKSAPSGALAHRALHDIDVRLAQLAIDFDDWQVLYRQRLQVERALGRSHASAETEDAGGPIDFVVDLIRRLVA